MTTFARAIASVPEGSSTTVAPPPVVGDGLLRRLDAAAQRVENALSRALPPRLNPLLQTGAIANVCLLLAIASGIVLLLWYVPSVHQAHASLERMAESPWTAQLTRSLHRYSSDGCMLFVLLHALRVVFARRFTGARWLAWVTGLGALVLLWVVGWLGYWLVWDQRAQQVALGTARLLDELPIFTDPLARSFLADATIHSLLFFVVFFAHMLLPVAMGIALWLHIARLARARFLTSLPLALWVLGSLVALSLAMPASSAPPAAMAVVPERFTMDWWYLAPLALTDRIGAGLLWTLLLAGGVLVFTVPWWARRRRVAPAQVEVARCNSCEQCAKDCPFNAITMVARTDGKPVPHQAQVDPARCVGCGICSGSCDSVGIGLPWFPVVDERQVLDRWLREAPGATVVLGCAHSAAGSLVVDPQTGVGAELADARVLIVPCAGWVHTLTIERAQRSGAREVVVVACGPGNCHFREGGAWIHQRVEGERKPSLRPGKADRARVRVLDLGAGEGRALRAALRGSGHAAAVARPSRARRIVAAAAGLLVTVALGVATWFGSDAPYRLPDSSEPELVVSFKHPGQVQGTVRERTAEELAKLPPHMRQARVVERARAAVRLRVVVDGVELLRQAYEPSGIWQDGNSVAVARFPLPAGRHEVEVAVGDSADPDEWSYRAQQMVELVPHHRRVVTFERQAGFVWH